MIWLAGIILGAYALLIIYFITGIFKTSKFHGIGKASTRFTIIVPFRNEKENLPVLIKSLSGLQYPKEQYEVLFVNDASTDGFVFPALPFSARILENIRHSPSAKKDAITTAISQARFEWILCTDADCTVPEKWLQVLDAFINRHNPDLVAGAVTYLPSPGFLNNFQELDLLSLQGVTVGSFGHHTAFMCNGANLAYRKSLFVELSGFEGIDKQPGGDDVFLLQKTIAAGRKVSYLLSDDFRVETRTVAGWFALFQQRVRWASKTAAYTSAFARFTAIIVLAANLAFICMTLQLPTGNNFLLTGTLLGIKIVTDYLLIKTSSLILGRPMNGFVFSALLYPFFSSFVAIYSLCGRYSWKERIYR